MKIKFNKLRTQKLAGWRAFSEQHDGDFVLRRSRSEHDKIGLYYKKWTLVIDTIVRSVGKSAATFTRARAHYHNADSFQFKVWTAHALSRIDKKFGQQDVEVGFQPFDKKFIIQGNNEHKLNMLFEDEKLRNHLMRVPKSFKLEIKTDHSWLLDDFREGESELCFELMGTITLEKDLTNVYDMMTQALDKLYQLGSAYEHAPLWRWKD